MGIEEEPFYPDQITSDELIVARSRLAEFLKNKPIALPRQESVVHTLCRGVISDISILMKSHGTLEGQSSDPRYVLRPRIVPEHHHLHAVELPHELNSPMLALQPYTEEETRQSFFSIEAPARNRSIDKPEHYVATLDKSHESFRSDLLSSPRVLLAVTNDRPLYVSLLQIAVCELLHALPEPVAENDLIDPFN
jgi:hypothetical protein